jgi:hypothetical protein
VFVQGRSGAFPNASPAGYLGATCGGLGLATTPCAEESWGSLIWEFCDLFDGGRALQRRPDSMMPPGIQSPATGPRSPIGGNPKQFRVLDAAHFETIETISCHAMKKLGFDTAKQMAARTASKAASGSATGTQNPTEMRKP